ncbi:MAG TPA: hypothetical protein VMY35_03765 [Phycisphaerae bacterium]|nr:hypothetical protein [Phycisphaerae bacterium]
MPKARLRWQRGIIGGPGDAVKARIVKAGVPCWRLAAQAGVSNPTLSSYLTGRRKSPKTQFRIYLAFRKLTRQRVTLRAFWGPFLSREVA